MSASEAGQEPHEDILEPALPIIDAHHHLYIRRSPPIHYLLPEFAADVGSGHAIEATMFIECSSMYRKDGPPEEQPLGEAEFVCGAAAMSASGWFGPARLCAGFVGHVDLRMPGELIAERASALDRASGGRLRGIRNAISFDASASEPRADRPSPLPHLMENAAFREGARTLGRLALPLDLFPYYTQHDEFVDFARAAPETTLICNHLGGVLGIKAHEGRRDEVFALWKASLAEIAAQPNVVLKLSGLGMPTSGLGLEKRTVRPTSAEVAALWRPYIETGIALFGADRCLFGSNFPNDRVSCAYPVVWNAFKRITAGASEDEKRALYFENARRVYQLNAIQPPS